MFNMKEKIGLLVVIMFCILISILLRVNVSQTQYQDQYQQQISQNNNVNLNWANQTLFLNEKWVCQNIDESDLELFTNNLEYWQRERAKIVSSRKSVMTVVYPVRVNNKNENWSSTNINKQLQSQTNDVKIKMAIPKYIMNFFNKDN